MATNDAKFLTGSLLRHISVMSVTSAFGLVALFLVDLIDMLFISMLGNEALAAAVGFAGAILFFTTSIGIGMSIAAGALSAQALGRNEPERAREILTHVIAIGFVLTCAIAAAIWLSLEPLTALVGAKGEVQSRAIEYLQIIIPTMPILMIGMIAAAALRSHGAATLSMMVTLTAGIVNAILDPIFIFTLDMGLNGAAWASVSARLSMATVALWFLYKRYGGLVALNLKSLIPDFTPVMAIAGPAVLANIATPVGSAYVTRATAQFGDEAVAGMAIIGRLTPISFALIFALSGAIGPIMGQNYGAKLFKRVRQTFDDALIFIAIYTVVIVILLYLLRTPIADMFGAQGIARDLIFLFCGPLSLAWIFNGIIFVGNAAYNNLGHPFYSTWINWGRNTLGIFPFVWIGAELAGAQGVLIGQMAGGVVVALVSWWLALHTIKVAEKKEIPDLHGPAFAPHHQRVFKILNHRR